MLVTLIEGPAVSLSIDADQIEQALINLIRNAVDAVALSGHVSLGWRLDGS
ncbi:MAG: histidine kinase, partial [Dokdonella sp.]|nr:histidine kinase [Dokdonella sp.]